jgi:hypothetical protein
MSPDEVHPMEYASIVRAHIFGSGSQFMNIDIKDIPSPSKLIATMDEHPVGAAFFVVTLLILLVGVAGCLWVYFTLRP